MNVLYLNTGCTVRWGFLALVPLLTRSSATLPNWMHSTQIPVGNKSNPQTCSEPSTELFIMLKSCSKTCLISTDHSKSNKSQVA